MSARAIILAAGLGSRLGGLTEHRPKCLIEVGGASLLTHSLAALQRAGVTETLIITGHAGEVVTQAVTGWTGPMAVSTLPTPDYKARGSMGSLLTAVEARGAEDCLLLESDLLYHSGFMTAALAAPGSAILTADPSGSGDEVWVCATPDGRLDFLGKAADPERRAQALGEFAGISRLCGDTLALYAEKAREWLAAGRMDAHYEEVLLALNAAGHPITVRHCPGLPWTEVDNEADLARAVGSVWPRLAAL